MGRAQHSSEAQSKDLFSLNRAMSQAPLRLDLEKDIPFIAFPESGISSFFFRVSFGAIITSCSIAHRSFDCGSDSFSGNNYPSVRLRSG